MSENQTKKVVNFRLIPGHHQKLQLLVRSSGRTLSSLLNEAVSDFLEEKKERSLSPAAENVDVDVDDLAQVVSIIRSLGPRHVPLRFVVEAIRLRNSK